MQNQIVENAAAVGMIGSPDPDFQAKKEVDLNSLKVDGD